MALSRPLLQTCETSATQVHGTNNELHLVLTEQSIFTRAGAWM